MTRRLHLVRHGEVHNPAGVVYGTLPGFGLSAHGREHAAAAAQRLRQTIVGTPRLVSSPLQRAQETASFIRDAFGVEVGTDERLIEARSFAMGLPRAFAPRAYLARLLDRDRPRNEAPLGIVERMLSAAHAACGDHDDAILVSHQFPIWMARLGLERDLEGPRARLSRLLPGLFVRLPCALGSITTVLLDDPRPETTTYWKPC